MDEIQDGLREIFRTTNRVTLAVSGTGSAGMEAAITNVIEPGDTAVVGVMGAFGARLASMVERCGGRALRVEAPWGGVIERESLAQAMAKADRIKVLALVHAETSTGVGQPLDGMAALCREHDALLLVDAVTSLAGMPLDVDAWGIDLCYSGTQKCLSCPPGLAPLTVSPRAFEVIRHRTAPCQSWYFDLNLIFNYWSEANRAYHHTAPVSMLYGLREALRLIHEEGLPARFARHRANGAALAAGLAELGLYPLSDPEYRLPMLTCVRLPRHIDDTATRAALLQEHGIEIGGGLGPLAGKVWRIGLMGESSRPAHVVTLLQALEDIGARADWPLQRGAAVQAAREALQTPALPIRSSA
jgi:alanine-glyoxylate transaminase/serine-glyoxylate transaminase/serine-pyruvate transaminase